MSTLADGSGLDMMKSTEPVAASVVTTCVTIDDETPPKVSPVSAAAFGVVKYSVIWMLQARATFLEAAALADLRSCNVTVTSLPYLAWP